MHCGHHPSKFLRAISLFNPVAIYSPGLARRPCLEFITSVQLQLVKIIITNPIVVIKSIDYYHIYYYISVIIIVSYIIIILMSLANILII